MLLVEKVAGSVGLMHPHPWMTSKKSWKTGNEDVGWMSKKLDSSDLWSVVSVVNEGFLNCLSDCSRENICEILHLWSFNKPWLTRTTRCTTWVRRQCLTLVTQLTELWRITKTTVWTRIIKCRYRNCSKKAHSQCLHSAFVSSDNYGFD